MRPDRVHFVDGGEEESAEMISGMVNRGTLIKLNDEKRPNSYLARSVQYGFGRLGGLIKNNTLKFGFKGTWNH